jgi:hypothetical protein
MKCAYNPEALAERRRDNFHILDGIAEGDWVDNANLHWVAATDADATAPGTTYCVLK